MISFFAHTVKHTVHLDFWNLVLGAMWGVKGRPANTTVGVEFISSRGSGN